MLSGCAYHWPAWRQTDSMTVAHADEAVTTDPATVNQISTQSQSPPPQVVTAAREVPSASSNTAIDAVVDEVRQDLALTIAEELELRRQLAQSRPDEWSLVAQHFRSILAYRQELLTRESRQSPPPQLPENEILPAASPLPTAVPENRSADGTAERPARMPERASVTDRLPPAPSQRADVRVSSNVATQSAPERGSTHANYVTDAVHEANSGEVQLASFAAESTSTTWQELLSSAIEKMEQAIPPEPGSTDELAEHMRLSMLLLMAGRQEQALQPLPGASIAEQEFWSKQLFALSTYLDSERQPDRKRRAAGTLVHLDQARSRLAEIASLQIQNLTFVSSVDGYGTYEPLERTTFQPGEQVNLYAEIENFRSESNKDGYRTSLSTSYEVVDTQGRHVEGAQFPEVVDQCKSLRRDFHMQYGVVLPTRIYPGEYQLQLTITDQLSNKIAQASVPFQIAE